MADESIGWFEWATGYDYDDVGAAAKQGAAQGLCTGVFGASACVQPADILTADQIKAQDQAARDAALQGKQFCDRTTVLGRVGFCEAQDALRGVTDFVTSPAVTLAVGAVTVGVGTLAVLALANVLGATPVLQAGGRATAAGIRGASRLVGGR